MPEISLTDFVDFASRSGTRQLTKVRELKARGAYNPAHDFWKRLRDGIVAYHSRGGPITQLDAIVTGLTDPKKRRRYLDAVANYKRWLGRKQITWFQPPRAVWSQGGLDVKVNPELGLDINGQRHAIKLYFKSDRLGKYKVDVVSTLMVDALQTWMRANPDTELSVLDIGNRKLFPSSRVNTGALVPLLIGQASMFVTIWNSI